MKIQKILVFGGFDFKNNLLDGQTIKTRNVLELLHKKKNSGGFEVDYFDTSDLKINKSAYFVMLRKLLICNVLIYLPAHYNLKYALPFVFLITKIRKAPIIYIVVGGWLADYIRDKPLHVRLLRHIRSILPETQLLKQRLGKEYNITNTKVFQNFRIQDFIPCVTNYSVDGFLRLVFMSRINRMKGYEMIFEAAETFEQKGLKIVIDFYGPVLDADLGDFFAKIDKYNSVQYKGVLEPDDIYSTLSKYDILLLPTKYYTEGLPGAIVDAYISGIPVIVTKWLHAHEFVDNDKTGYIIPFENGKEMFVDRIIEMYNDRTKLDEFKKNALLRSRSFSVEHAWETLNPLLDN